MLTLILFQSVLICPPILIKEEPKNVWVYQKHYDVKDIDWSYTQSLNEKLFGTPKLFVGTCNSVSEKDITNEVCDFYYASDIIDFSGNTIRLYVKGKGRFRISINSSKGYISKEVELNDSWQEVSFDLSKSIYITQHGEKLKTNLKIIFTPLSKNFEIYISKFLLK